MIKWNWQLPDWPHFTYDPKRISSLEQKFLQGAGGLFAVLKQLNNEKQNQFIVEVLCTEGVNSAEIEGEILERESLQSSIQRHLGMSIKKKKPAAKEEGMAELLYEMYTSYQKPLSHKMLYHWHKLLMKGNTRITDIGKYRTHKEPMQIVSVRSNINKVFFEAPPSDRILQEMTQFINWFNDSSKVLSLLEKASICHLYFESIHPFEDGNGRIGRVLVEKALSHSLQQPTLLAISQVITRRKKEYYAALGKCNTTLDSNDWLAFFAHVIVQSQEDSLSLINFLIAKSRIMNSLKGRINPRQEKVLLRIFKEGTQGFSGGLSAENYIAITKTSRATATRDLTDLTEKGVFIKKGQLRHTRYYLNLDQSC